jgi:hypothetical protein
MLAYVVSKCYFDVRYLAGFLYLAVHLFVSVDDLSDARCAEGVTLRFETTVHIDGDSGSIDICTAFC